MKCCVCNKEFKGAFRNGIVNGTYVCYDCCKYSEPNEDKLVLKGEEQLKKRGKK